MSAFRSSKELAAKPWRPKVLIYAPTHTGKTDAMLTFPGIVAVDVENRLDEFATRTDRFAEFTSAAATGLEDARERLADLRAGRVPCDFIGLDSVSALYIMVALDAMKRTEKNGVATYTTDYATVNRRVAALASFVNSITDRGVVWTAHEGKKWERNGEQFRFAGAKLVSNEDLRFAFGYIIRLERKDNLFLAHAEKSASPRLAVGQHFTYKLGERFYDAFHARCAPRADGSPAVATPPSDVIAQDDHRAERVGTGLLALDTLLSEIDSRRHQQIMALAKAKKLDGADDRPLRMLLSEAAGRGPLNPDTVERAVEALKAVHA